MPSHRGASASSITSGTSTPVPVRRAMNAADAAALRVVIELMALESMVWKNAMPTPVASTRAMVDAQSAADDGPYPWVE